MRRASAIVVAVVGAVTVALFAARDGVPAPAGVECSRTATPVNPNSLSGVWRSSDGGTYWIRQVGTCLYWAGFSAPLDSPDMGTTFSNVFVATVFKTSISGEWADVPRGSATSSGNLTLRIRSTKLLTRLKSTGGFSGTVWTKTR